LALATNDTDHPHKHRASGQIQTHRAHHLNSPARETFSLDLTLPDQRFEKNQSPYQFGLLW
jgi:hypothetical protein